MGYGIRDMRKHLTYLISHITYPLLLLVLLTSPANAISLRSQLNQGNNFYKKEQYEKAESIYSQVLRKEKDQKAKFNLGNSLYKQNRFEVSQKIFETLTKEARSKKMKQQSYYNLGNSYFKQSDFKSAITVYEEALKIDPKDKDTQHNLKLAKMMLKMTPEQRKKQQDKDKQKDQDKQDKNQGGQGKKNNDQVKQQEQKKEKPGQMSKEDAERLLRAIENQEKHKNTGTAPRQGSGQGSGKDW